MATTPSTLHAKQLLATDAYSVGSLTSAGDLTTTGGDVVIGAAKDLKLNGTALASSGGAAKVGVNPAGWVKIAGAPSTVQAAFAAVETALSFGGAVTGAGANTRVALWSGASSLTSDANIQWVTPTHGLYLTTATSTSFVFDNARGSGIFLKNTPAAAGAYTLYLESAGGTAGTCLKVVGSAGSPGIDISSGGQPVYAVRTGNGTTATFKGAVTSTSTVVEIDHVVGQNDNQLLLNLRHATGGDAHRFLANGDHVLYSATANIPNGSAITLRAANAMSGPASYVLTLPGSKGNANEVLITDGNGTTSWNSPQGLRRFALAANTYTVANTDNLVTVNFAGPVVITLPAPSSANKDKIFIIKDISGNAAANHITIQYGGAGGIDGASPIVISVDYGALQVFNDGSKWYTL